jgi:Archaeal/vacuolar-type H+-ATPase subunit I
MIVGWALLVISLVLLFISKGGLFIFSITGLLGDILSYARLMALGIVTSGIGNVVNLLAVLPLGMGALGWIFAAIIFLLGHALNFAINFLGAAVHGIRLEYAEFFSKFYAGGGAEFTPFEMKREVTENIKKI